MIIDLDFDHVIPTTGYSQLTGSSAIEVNFCDRAKERLIWQFKTKPNIEAYLCVFANELAEIQTAFLSLKTARTLSSSTDVQLDGLGDLVGVERNGRTDTEYRLAIQTQILLNKSNGEPETLITAVKTLTESTNVNITEMFPAEVNLLFDGLTIPSDLITSIENSAPAGVKINATASYSEASVFSFEADPGDTPVVGNVGFSEPNYAPDSGKGGSLTEVIT